MSAVAVAFVANGLGGPSFLARLPERQSDLGLSDATLGLTLVGMALGAMAASPAAGGLVSRLGSRPVLVIAAAGLGASLWTVGAAPNAPTLFAALTLVGATDAAMDISMNANGAAYENRSGRSVMHGLHGTWSLGALAAAGIAAASAATGVPLTVHLALAGAVIAGSVLVARQGLVGGDAQPRVAAGPADPGGGGEPAAPSRPRLIRPIVVLAAATVGGAIIEGAPSDWSAIQMERMGVGSGVSALGYAAFMAGMVGGRFAGDRLTDRLGGAVVLRGGTALVAVGLVTGIAVNQPAPFAIGLALAGLGAAGFFPLAFSAAARTAGVSPGSGAATVSLAARLGFMLEPLLMGAVADLVGLRWAFGLVAGVALVVAATAPRIVAGAGPPATVRLVDVREP
ncbi:MAG TPA: MFS transporter [Acidimicrobiales bacterium]|nr:MFS transporter [Acidimicrobiales bacterium]